MLNIYKNNHDYYLSYPYDINVDFLRKYDENFKSSYSFNFPLFKNKKCRIVSKRYLVNSFLNKYIYLYDLSIDKTKDGFLLQMAENKILLNKIGTDIYILSYLNCKNKLSLNSMLHTFIKNNNCVIDVSKFKRFFTKEETKIIKVFKKN